MMEIEVTMIRNLIMKIRIINPKNSFILLRIANGQNIKLSIVKYSKKHQNEAMKIGASMHILKRKLEEIIRRRELNPK